MIRQMSAKQLMLWHAYAQIEPFGEWWATRRTAATLQMQANINRDSKRRPEPYKLDEFILKLDAGEEKPFRTQTPKQQAQVLEMWMNAFVATRKEKKRRAG